MSKRAYSEEDRATALAFLQANRGNLSATAKHTGIPRNTIRFWSEGEMARPLPVELSTRKKADLADRFEEEANAALDHAARVRDEATYMQAMTSAGIAADKAAMLREKAAPSPEQVRGVLDEVLGAIRIHVTDESALGEIGALFSRLAEGLSGGS